jgi:hypothetical protein
VRGPDCRRAAAIRSAPAPGTTAEKYDATQPLIEEAAGQWPPDGLDYHVAFSSGGDIRVSEIWDSQEQFEAFGAVLMPVLAANGVELAGPPEVFEVHNIIKR